MTSSPGRYVDPTTGEIHVPDDDNAAGGAVELVDTTPAVPDAAGGPLERLPMLKAMITDAVDRSLQDPEDISRAIIERILSAGTADEVLAASEARHAREILGEPIIVTGIRLNTSDYKEGFGAGLGGGQVFYMLVDAETADGDEIVVTCGGRFVMAQLYRLAQLDAFPAKVKFTQPTKPTRAGFFPLRVEPA